MSNKTITELLSLTNCPSSGDLFVLDDISDGVTKHINFNTLAKYINAQNPGVNGGVFFTDVRPVNSETGNISNKVFSSDGTVLESFTTDTKDVIFSFIALTGHTNYKPNVTFNNSILPISETSNKSIFSGSFDVSLIDKPEKLSLYHEDGPINTVNITYIQVPEIGEAIFINGYPNEQIEVKENDTVNIQITSDIEFSQVEIENYEACKHYIYNVTLGTQATVDAIIDDSGNSSIYRPAKVRVITPNGGKSEWVYTTDFGDIHDINTILCNNTHPSIVINSITYPNNQQALKNDETAILNNTILNYDRIEYSSNNSEFNFTNSTNYEPIKYVSRISGTYNISSNNFKIWTRKESNGAETIKNGIINIAHTTPIINITEQYSKLRHDMSTKVNIVSNQHLLNVPTIEASVGTWQHSTFLGGPINFYNHLFIGNSVENGEYTWNNLHAVNLAGIEVNTINGNDTYEIGGFAEKIIYFGSFQSIALIGTNVDDTSKLNCIEISGEEMTYKNDDTPCTFCFTIVNENGEVDSHGKYIKILDEQWVSKNSTGLSYVTLEEQV